MKTNELKQIIKEELNTVLNENDSLNTEILNIIQNMHILFNKLKNEPGIIPRQLTRKLYTDFKPLYNTLNSISDILMKIKGK